MERFHGEVRRVVPDEHQTGELLKGTGEHHREANIGTESTTGQSTPMTPPLHTPHTPPSQRANGDGGSAHTKAKGTTSLDTSIVAAASKSKNKMIAAEVAAKNLLAYVQQDPKWSWCCAGNLVKLQNEV